MPGRRAAFLITVASVAAAYIAVPRIAAFLEPPLRFEPLPGLNGFRQLSGGSVSGGNPALVGIDASDARPDAPPVCAHLFSETVPVEHVPVAYFSDARCVYCKVLSPLLHELETTEPITVTWHELPLLGTASLEAAKAALAARQQGAYAFFHDRLMGTPFLPTPAYLRQLAADAGINADRLLNDMQDDAVSEQITRTAALARLFGFYGTPALVVGRTAVLGTVDSPRLRRLIEIEATMTAPGPCR